MAKKLTQTDIDLICDLLGQVAVNEAERGNEKKEARIFELINKLEDLEVSN